MLVILLQIIGWVVFVSASFIAGKLLKRRPSRANAERTSRVIHALFFTALAGPTNLGIFYPGLRNYDRLLGLRPLPFRTITMPLGGALVAAGAYLMAASNLALRQLGHGANAFRLTRQLVASDIYARTRNPMSLGYYLMVLGIGLLFRSTAATLGAILAVIPAHLFCLRYFEERELELRLGQDYLDYKRRVPFLVPRLR